MNGEIVLTESSYRELLMEIRTIVREEFEAARAAISAEPAIHPDMVYIKRREITQYLGITDNQFQYLRKRNILELDENGGMTMGELKKIAARDIKIFNTPSGRTRIERRTKPIH